MRPPPRRNMPRCAAAEEEREKRRIANERARAALERDREALLADQLQNAKTYLELAPQLPAREARRLRPTVGKRRLPEAS